LAVNLGNFTGQLIGNTGLGNTLTAIENDIVDIRKDIEDLQSVVAFDFVSALPSLNDMREGVMYYVSPTLNVPWARWIRRGNDLVNLGVSDLEVDLSQFATLTALNDAINTRLPLAGGTLTGNLTVNSGLTVRDSITANGPLNVNEVAEFNDNVHTNASLYVHNAVPANANDGRVAPTAWVRDRLNELDLGALDFSSPIMVDNAWHITNRIPMDDTRTVKAGVYVFRGSATYPLETISNRLWQPALRNLFFTVTVPIDMQDPIISGSWNTASVELNIIGSHGIPQWRMWTSWEEDAWDTEWNATEFALIADGSWSPTFINEMGVSVNSWGISVGAPPMAADWHDFGLISASGLARSARRTMLTGTTAQTDFNLMVNPGSFSIAPASILANSPPITMTGQLRRVCHVTQTANNGIIQELEVFSDNLATPFQTWKRVRRTNTVASWAAWQFIAGHDVLFNGHVWGNAPVVLTRRPLNGEILLVEGGFGDVQFAQTFRIHVSPAWFHFAGMVLGGHSTVFSQGNVSFWGGGTAAPNSITGSWSTGHRGGHYFNGWRANIGEWLYDHWIDRITSLGGAI